MSQIYPVPKDIENTRDLEILEPYATVLRKKDQLPYPIIPNPNLHLLHQLVHFNIFLAKPPLMRFHTII